MYISTTIKSLRNHRQMYIIEMNTFIMKKLHEFCVHNFDEVFASHCVMFMNVHLFLI